MDVTALFKDADNSAVLVDANDPADGYAIAKMPDTDLIWRVLATESYNVDGDSPDHASLARLTLNLSVRVRGSSYVQLIQRRQTLLAAVSQRLWFLHLTVEGVTHVYRCSWSDAAVLNPPDTVVNRMLVVGLAIRAQPLPTVSYA